MCNEINEFDEIRPYTDEEAVVALNKLADNPMVLPLSKYILPDRPETFLRDYLRSVKGVEDFQSGVMTRAVEWVLKNTVHNFSYDGFENFKKSPNKFVAISNHRDIIIDPALTQIILYRNKLPMTQIAVGSNLLSNQTMEWLIRSNRMIKVIRGINARSLYLSSHLLSRYIRKTVTSGTSSVWIAQREGRSKNGIDTTEQGLLKMLDMSGTMDFVSNFEELNVIPLSISYEYEPCDILKARETLISRNQKYVKDPNEDMMSIITGIRQQKGNVHLNIGDPLSHDEIAAAANCSKNDRYQAIRQAVDKRIIEGYKLWKTNYIAYDLLNQSYRFRDKYTPEDSTAFVQYVEAQLDQVDRTLNRSELRDIFLGIYANPIVSKDAIKKEA